MGYHIVNLENGQLQNSYVKSENQLVDVDFITKETIIYQGEEDWKPIRVGDSEKYKNYCEESFRDGLKAQRLFKSQAKEQNFIVEELSQDIESFKDYLVEKEFRRIKRGDFLLRNLRNLEIEVKCKKIYTVNKKNAFFFDFEDLEGHLNMQNYTTTPIIVAFYERKVKDVNENEPYFIPINTIDLHRKDFKTKNENSEDSYFIPIPYLNQGFKFLKEFKW